VSEGVVLGTGFLACALGQLLGWPVLEPENDDTGWGPASDSVRAQRIMIVGSNASASQLIRWHADARRRSGGGAASCVVLTGSEYARDELLRRDVFGRLDVSGETFRDWCRYVAVMPYEDPLTAVLGAFAGLQPCPVATWNRHEREAAFTPQLLAAVMEHDTISIDLLAPAFAAHDWDSICFRHPRFGGPHEYANRLRSWFASTRHGPPIAWDVGESLLAPLARGR